MIRCLLIREMSLDITLKHIIPCLIDNTVLVSLTNYGYLLYTLNMLKSLRPYDLDKKVLVVAIDQKSYSILKKKGYSTVFIEYPDDELDKSKFYPWNSKGYDKVCYYKLELIYQILLLQKNILLIDGDIVFQKDPRPDIEEWNKSVDDVWIQNDAEEDNNTENMCTGYMFVRSTEKMIALYDCVSPSGKEKYMKCALDNNDQTYFNKFVKPFCTMKPLPLILYPNGSVFYKTPSVTEIATLLHFNWVKGHEKMVRMKEYRKWLLTPEEE